MKKTIITILLALVAMMGQAQEERIDTVIPKFLSNGYFFREMPALPDGEKTMSRLKDKEGNSVIVINVDATLPKSLIRKAIPREQVHNADQFLSGLNMMATVTSLTQAGCEGRRHVVFTKGGRAVPAVLGERYGRAHMDERQRERARHGAQPLVLRLWPLPCRDAHSLRVEGAIAWRNVLLGHLPRC